MRYLLSIAGPLFARTAALKDAFYTWRHGRAIDSSQDWQAFTDAHLAGDRS